MSFSSLLRNHLILLSGFCLLSLAPASGSAQASDREELLRIHRVMLEKMILQHDGALFEAVALDQLLLIPPGGILETKEEALAGIRAFAVEQLLIEDEVVTQEGNTAVVVAKMTLTGVVQPVGRLGPMRTMSVFVRVDDHWRLLARSLTPCLAVAVQAGRC